MGRKIEDLTGRVFGRLTVIREVAPYIDKNGGNHSKWKCMCECGNTVEVLGQALKKGSTKSCGCISKERRSKSGKSLQQDLTGQRFGRLIVMEYVGKDKSNHSMYKCLCDCGNTTIVRHSHLKSGLIRSCGCLKKETATQPKTHGGTLR